MSKGKRIPDAVMRQYLSARASYPDAFMLFRMGDCYEFFCRRRRDGRALARSDPDGAKQGLGRRDPDGRGFKARHPVA
jgi:hypothetical protein